MRWIHAGWPHASGLEGEGIRPSAAGVSRVAGPIGIEYMASTRRIDRGGDDHTTFAGRQLSRGCALHPGRRPRITGRELYSEWI